MRLFYYFSNAKILEAGFKVEKNTTVGDFLKFLENVEFKDKFPKSSDNSDNVYLRCRKLDIKANLNDYLEELKYNALFVSHFPDQAIDYCFFKDTVSIDDYQEFQYLHNSGACDIIKAIHKKTKKEVEIFVPYVENAKDIFATLRGYNVAYSLNLQGVHKLLGVRYPLKENEIDKSNLPKIEFTDNRRRTVNDLSRFIFVFEHIKNGPIDTKVKEYLDSNGEKHDDINPTIRSKIIYGVASIMKKVHQRGAIHRDLTIGNIYLDDKFEPVISGFDSSRS